MSEYILASNGELYHWKYVKREKVGDKWKYYYDTNQLKTNVQNKVGVIAKNNYQNVSKATQSWNKQSASARNKTIMTEATGEKYNIDQWRYFTDLKRKYDSKDKVKAAKSEYNKTLVSKLDKSSKPKSELVTKTEKWFKDKMGYDEKAATKTADVNAKVKKYEYEDTVKKNEAWKAKNPNSTKIKEMADWQNNYYKEMADEALAKHTEAIKKYEKTPLAKLEKAKESIDSAKEWIDQIAKKRKKK